VRSLRRLLSFSFRKKKKEKESAMNEGRIALIFFYFKKKFNGSSSSSSSQPRPPLELEYSTEPSNADVGGWLVRVSVRSLFLFLIFFPKRVSKGTNGGELRVKARFFLPRSLRSPLGSPIDLAGSRGYFVSWHASPPIFP
jgi:hypothetical protein